MENFFKLKENNTTVRTEVMAGITTFMTMAYILVVNPNILSSTGMDYGAVFMATCIASAIGTICMALFSNYPFVLAPGMGLNAYFAYTVVLTMGYSWQTALAAVFLEGVIFIVLTLTNVREAIFDSIPQSLKYGVSAGIGMFIAFIGLQNANIVVSSATLVGLFSFKGAIADGTMANAGMSALLALIGILVTAVLIVKKVRGNILWGILITWVLGMLCQVAGIYVPDNETYFSVFPSFSGYSIPSMSPTFFKMDFSNVFSLEFASVIFAFLFVDLFDTLGTLIGVANKADMLDKDGKLPKIKGALMADSVATCVGAVCGTSTVTTYVESSSGVAEGGRTGLTSIVSAILFALSIFLAPIFQAIPSFATAPALVMVGFLMISSVAKLDFSDPAESIPAFIAIISMCFMYSISEGIAMGTISYAVIDIFQRISGKKETKPSILLYILAVIFVLKYIVL